MSKEIKVLIVSGDFPPRISGVGDYSAHVASALNGLGIEVIVITTAIESLDDAWSGGSVDAHYSMSRWQMSEIRNLLDLIEKDGSSTIVNIQYYCPATYGRRLMINFLPAILRLVRPNARVVITMHGFWEQSKLFRLRTVPMLRASHGVIYVDRLNKTPIEKYGGFDPEHMKLIPIASNILPITGSSELRKKWRQELGFSDHDTVLTFFGGIGRIKGFEYLIDAIEYLRKSKGASTVLLAIGGFHADGVNAEYQSNIRRLISESDRTAWIRIIESPPAMQVSKYLHAADIAVFPFVNGVGENSGSMLAALAHGLPTIITEGPSNDSSFSERFGVDMVPARNTRLLAASILDIVCSKSKQEYMKNKALLVSKQLTWEYVAKETLGFFKALL
jgi:glycosyltransferase involved in cell wall biosynthesis